MIVLRIEKGSVPPRGFALIATISVMILLVMVALSMLSLSAIELRGASALSFQNEAQANARMALMLAIAELQDAVGPDQRMTASADLAGSSDGSALSDGAAPANNTYPDGTSKGLTQVLPGTRHWLGVWEPTSTDPAQEIYTQTPTAKFRQWLVSGASTMSSLSPNSSNYALSSQGVPVDKSMSVVLAGHNTVGDPNSETLSNYVSAPLVSISGTGRQKGKTTGHYAWWVGDEGAKSRNNLSVDYNDTTNATYPMLLANRRGWEVVDGFSQYPKLGGDQSLLERSITRQENGLIDASFIDETGGASPLQKTFHAATPYSIGLLTNMLGGGLKVDLTRYLEDGFPTSPTGSTPDQPLAENNIIPNSVAPDIKGPKWKQLKQFSDLGKTLSSSSDALIVQSGDLTIAPIISDFRLLLGMKVVPLEGNDPLISRFRSDPCAKVAIVLTNPYSHPLKWNSALELQFRSIRHETQLWVEFPGKNKNPFHPSWFFVQGTDRPCLFHKCVFEIKPSTIPPGESVAYTVSQDFLIDDNGVITVSLDPFTSSNPTDFKNCVRMTGRLEMEYPSSDPQKTYVFDIREGTESGRIQVKLSLSGDSQLLREINDFELDNAEFDTTDRWIRKSDAVEMVEPFPLQLYSFQLSQPGADYASILPSNDHLGLRSSTMRTFTDFNLQGVYCNKLIASYNPPPYFMRLLNSRALLPYNPPGGDTGPAFTRNLAIPRWGYSPNGPMATVLFSPPSEMVSLAQFQHADLTADDYNTSISHQPGNAVGNSYASPFVKRAFSMEMRKDYHIEDSPNVRAANRRYYDLSYLLNASLWDGYYLSTISSSGGDTTPQNVNMFQIHQPSSPSELRDAKKAAAFLAVKGSFNVNSTNKEAWKALIASTQNLKHPSDTSAQEGAMFPRSLEQLHTSANPPSGNASDSWSGYRRLSHDEVDALAEEICRQVRLRGPFTSMAHFINRALLPLDDTTKAMSRSGALQSAIDLAGLTISPDGTQTAFSLFSDSAELNDEKLHLQADGGYPRADLAGNTETRFANSATPPVWASRSRGGNPGNVASILADRSMLTDFQAEQGFRSTGSPAWLTQADLLQSLGPVLSARSDTFRIRAYGESVNPDNGKVRARAWCEAIVQRMPEYLDASNRAEILPDNLNPVNKKFGRRLKMISFRWLSHDEI